MNTPVSSHEELVRRAQLSPNDLEKIHACRQAYTRLGFAYQLAFVRLNHRFPAQQPLEIMDELLTYVTVQLDLPSATIQAYQQQRRTIINHQQEIRTYLNLRSFGESEIAVLNAFLFEEACRLEQTGPLLVQAKQFLKEEGILFPADDTLRRLIVTQRQAAREHIFTRIANSLSPDLNEKLDALLVAGTKRLTPFHWLKQPPGRPSPPAILRLAEKLEQIQETGVLTIDLSWLNNNYQRFLTRYAHRCSADRLRNLQAEHRYAVLVCFLWQVYRDTIDHMLEMHSKLMTSVYNRAQDDIDEQNRKQRQMIRSALTTLRNLGQIILDESVRDETLRQVLFSQVDREKLASQLAHIETWLTGKYSHVFNLVVQRYAYLRQFAPT
ncbi:MAG: DUF4158 domain-containing protein, partial [Chloroflexi bacterium]|nr:DUF4158 domain-containing protein [Chloroflexota bacterium]